MRKIKEKIKKNKGAIPLLLSWQMVTKKFIKEAVRKIDKTSKKETKKGLKEIAKSKNLLGQFLFKRKIEKAVLKEVTMKWWEYNKQLLKKGYQLPLERIYEEITERVKKKKMKSTVSRRTRKMIKEYLNDFFKSQYFPSFFTLFDRSF